jgi:hypothetical protein
MYFVCVGITSLEAAAHGRGVRVTHLSRMQWMAEYNLCCLVCNEMAENCISNLEAKEKGKT